MKTELVDSKLYRDAIFAQDACNLSGLAHSLANLTSKIREVYPNTISINQHPIVQLIVYQMAYLSGIDRWKDDDYFKALKHCREMAASDV